MARLAAWTSNRCSPVCSLQQRQRGDRHKGEQRGQPTAAVRRSTLPGLQQESLGALASTQQQQAASYIEQSAPLVPPVALAAAGFVAVAADIFAPGSLHVLQPLDQWAHAAVSSAHWDPTLQRLLAGKLVSDAAIVAGLAGWAAVAVAAVLPTQPASPRLLRALGISAAAYLLAGGSIKHGDTPLVAAMKEGWHRARPSEVLHTFAFPSGHTTAATFICGTLLFVLLPAALKSLGQGTQQAAKKAPQQQRQQQQQPSGGLAQLGLAGQQAASWVLERRLALWAIAVGVTAAGRVAADAHWCSDVLAGALLGITLTGLTVQLCAGVESGALPLVPWQMGAGQRQQKRDQP